MNSVGDPVLRSVYRDGALGVTFKKTGAERYTPHYTIVRDGFGRTSEIKYFKTAEKETLESILIIERAPCGTIIGSHWT